MSGGSRLGGSPAAGALGSDLHDMGLEEAEEFSWEVCFSSVGISGPGAPALALAEGSDLQQSDAAAALSWVSRDPVSNHFMPQEVPLWVLGFSTLGSRSSPRGAA